MDGNHAFSDVLRLIKRPNASKELLDDRNSLLPKLMHYVRSLNEEFQNKVKREQSSDPVSTIVSIRQIYDKVEHICTTVKTLTSESSKVNDFVANCNTLMEELRKFEKSKYEIWCKLTEEILEKDHEKTLLMTGRKVNVELKPKCLQVSYSEELTLFLKQTRVLTVLGYNNPPKKIRTISDVTQRYFKQAIALSQIAGYYTSTFAQIIPCQEPMLREHIAAFHKLITSKTGKGTFITWNSPGDSETFVEKLQQIAERITKENRKLRKYHVLLNDRIAELMNVDIIKHQDKWRDTVKELRNVVDSLENQGYKNTMQWRLHCDHQLYKALEFQYKISLECLNETLTELKNVELVYSHQQLQFRPPFEEIRLKYYNNMKRCIKYPSNFVGISNSDIFKHMVHRNPQSLNLVYSKAEDLFNRLAHEKEQFEEWVALGSVNIDTYVEENLHEVSDWEENFKMLKVRAREVELLPSEKRIDCINISFAPVKASIDDIIQRLADALINSLRKSIMKHINQAEEYVNNATEVLSQRPTTVDEISQVTVEYKKLLQEKPNIRALVETAEAKNKLLRSVAGVGVNTSSFQNKWENLEISMEFHEVMIKEQLDNMKGNVDNRIIDINNDFSRFVSKWDSVKPTNSTRIENAEAARNLLASLRELKSEFDEIKNKSDGITSDCKVFEMEAPSFAGLDSLHEEFKKMEAVWNLYDEFSAEIDKLGAESWTSIRGRLYVFEDLLNAWTDKLKTLGRDPMSNYFKIELQKYKDLQPLLKYVRGDVFSTDHWHELYKILGMEKIPSVDLTLKHFLNCMDAILKNADTVKELNSRAQGEITIKEALQELKSWAAESEFTLIDHTENGRSTPLIRDWKDLMTQVGDNQSLLQSLKDSPYFKKFADEAGSWEAKLGGLAEYLQKLNNIQRRWVYLEPIFGRGALPQEQARFNKVDTEFRSIMLFIGNERRVIALVDYSGIKETLTTLLDQLERCQKALNEFLEQKRAGFPRFYFIGDDDLLEILGQAKNPAVIQTHLKKLFQGINSVEFSSNFKQITAMKSSLGEVVHLQTPVAITDKVEEWLRNLASEMKATLKQLLIRCVESTDYDYFPSQILCTADAIHFTRKCEAAIQKGQLKQLHSELRKQLSELTTYDDQGSEILRSKLKALILDVIHNMDVVEQLRKAEINSINSWAWQKQLRFYLDSNNNCKIRMCEVEFEYTYEYQGNAPKLVHTPLTDKCYLTLTQAMGNGYGGNPYGPAGTGKTESVKALGQLFARQVLVFNCDEGIDFKSMGRIFTGIVKCGAWGCFDEFNRLDEEVLSAVSQQIQVIQSALKHKQETMVLLGTTIEVDGNSGIFVTLNPAGKGYGGRSKLPDNLKQLFRSVAMSAPDLEQISEVILYSEGFTQAKELGQKLVSIFSLCKQLLSPQQHYDWGLRALKVILNVGGQILQKRRKSGATIDIEEERSVLVQALRINTLSKLTFADSKRFNALVGDVFPGLIPQDVTYESLEAEIKKVLTEMKLDILPGQVKKILQFYEALNQRMGVVIVGPGGCGKSTLWNVLKAALFKLKKRVVTYTMNPKALPRQQLLGHMDLDTREWFDGVLTAAARNAVKESSDVDSWIICDGDIDPEWIESLNSVLDDNRLLTMPNGERIQFGSNVNFIFETHSLKWASPATVSRMGMIFLADEDMDRKAQINSWLRHAPEETRNKISGWVESWFNKGVQWVTQDKSSVVETTLGGLVKNGLSQLREVNAKGEFVVGLIRGLGSNLDTEKRTSFAREVFAWAGDTPPDRKQPLNCYFDSSANAYKTYDSQVSMELNLQQLNKQPVVPITDVRSNADILLPWLRNGDPFLIVGPEGCGKAMLLRHCFLQLKSCSIAMVHCNSQTAATHVIQKLYQACNVFSSTKGRVLRPKEGEKLVLYLKDINLPKPDKYETIQLIAFLQQLITYEGFYDENLEWLGLEKIQIVASMNPSTTVGRHQLTTRFTSLMRICYVAYPTREQLQSIYSTYLDACLSPLNEHVIWRSKQNRQKLASTMVEIYDQVKTKFRVDEYSHYLFTPRDLTKWVLALQRYQLETQELLEVVSFEGQRIFRDRLVDFTSRQKFDRIVEGVMKQNWGNIPAMNDFYFSSFNSTDESTWAKKLVKISVEELKERASQGLIAYEREARDLHMILFNEILDHIIKTDRVLSRPGGSMLLIGKSGVGRRSAVSLTAFMHNMRVFSPNMSRWYSVKNFKTDLKQVLQVAGVEGEHVVFLLEDHQFIYPEFIEIINSLLSSGEVPGLYTPEELEPALSPLKDKLSEEGFYGTLFQFFVERIKNNLHVILIMDPRNEQFQMRCEANPALYTQCDIQWWDTWAPDALQSIPYILLKNLIDGLPNRDLIVKSLVEIHDTCSTFSATPRDFINLLHTYKKIYDMKREAALEQQKHLQGGLTKLADASLLVDNLSHDAEKKKMLLAEKREQANQALAEITTSMQTSSEQKKNMQELEESLGKERTAIQERKAAVEAKLSNIQPVLDAAKQAVGGIQASTLSEMKSLATPPEAIRDVLSGVLCILGEYDNSWQSMKNFLGNRGVKERLLNFDAHSVTTKSREKVQEILKSKGKSFEESVISKANKAAAPLAAWVKAVLEYSTVLESIAPMEQDLAKLTKRLATSEKKLQSLRDGLIQLDQKIAQLKADFAARTEEASTLKIDLEKAESTLAAAQTLLSKLGGEKERWDKTIADITKSLEQLPYNALLAAAFVTYLSAHSEDVRKSMVQKWAAMLNRPDWNFKQFMSTESELLVLKAEGLPADDLSMENSIVIQQSIKTPFIIDPSTQASEWLQTHLKDKKLEVTTQDDARFTNTLELSVRFGKTLVIEEVDQIHPILFPLLRQDLIHQGPRSVVQLGDKTIDYNEDFKLYLVTRNSTPILPPDVVPLISVVNFTTTRSGLEGQLLGITIKHEKPELEEKKSQLLLLEEEQKVQLSNLEKQLLVELASSQGNILENKSLIDSLNETKSKSLVIANSLKEAHALQISLDSERNAYRRIATEGSALYFLMIDLQKVNNMYQFSLPVFLKLFQRALETDGNSKPTVEVRVKQVCAKLQSLLYEFVSRSIFKADRLTFALHMVHTMYPKLFRDQEWELFVGKLVQDMEKTTELPSWAAPDRKNSFSLLSTTFPSMVQALNLKDTAAWGPWAKSPACESEFPTKYAKSATPFQRILLIQALRPDRLETALNAFVCELLQLKSLAPPPLNFQRIYSEETSPTEPILFIISPGTDPSQELEELAAKVVGKDHYHQIAMGQGQAEIALSTLRKAAEEGEWVCLKNLHLAISWLPTLEKEVNAMKPHENFRLWCTTEPHLKFSPVLLKSSLKITFESPPGIKKNLQRTYEFWSPEYLASGSTLRAQALFVLAWFHAIIQERRTFIPQGWSKFYEFSTADLRSSAEVLDKFCAKNNSPEWATIHGLLENAIYGGRVDNEYDHRVLRAYLQLYFSNDVIGKQPTRKIVKSINIPATTQPGPYLEIIQQLPDSDSPSLFYLPQNIDRALQITNSTAVINQLKVLNLTADAAQRFNREKWASELTPFIQMWQKLTTTNLSILSDAKVQLNQSEMGPVDTFVFLESEKAHNLARFINSSLGTLNKVIQGTALLSSSVAAVGSALLRGEVPDKWMDQWEGPPDPFNWMRGLVSRVLALDSWLERSAEGTLLSSSLDLSELFRPETFLNALRQQTARKTKCPVDKLRLISSPDPKLLSHCKVPVVCTGMLLQGAAFEGGKLVELQNEAPALIQLGKYSIGWVPQEEKDPYPPESTVECPLYTSGSREKCIAELQLPLGSASEKTKWVLAGIAIVLSE